MESIYHDTNDCDSYAGDADTVRGDGFDQRDRFNSDFYSLPGMEIGVGTGMGTGMGMEINTELNSMAQQQSSLAIHGTPIIPFNANHPMSLQSKERATLDTIGNIKRPPLEKRQSNRGLSVNNNQNSTCPLSPMNTVGTYGSLHRRINSTNTFTANSFALIFDANANDNNGSDNDNDQSPVTSRKNGINTSIVPKTVKTVKKKSRYGNNDFDDISPLDDNEDGCMGSRKFRERMNEIDCAIDDDATCSPIQRQEEHDEHKSFNFSQNPIAVDLFGGDKDNVANEAQCEAKDADINAGRMADVDLKTACASTLGKNALQIQTPSPEIHTVNDPEGIYLPISSVFQDESNPNDNRRSFEGWVAYSKPAQSKDGLTDVIAYIQNKNKIKRKHLRYVVISEDFMYVYGSKKSCEENASRDSNAYTDDHSNTNSNINNCSDSNNNVKVLKLSHHMSVEIKDVSRQHGNCIIIRDNRLMEMRGSDIVCSMLPVRLTRAYFKDEGCSQVVESREFDIVRKDMFGQKTAPALLPAPVINVLETDRDRAVLRTKATKKKECITPHPGSMNKKTAEWPRTVCETVPIEQNTAALFMQFALDTAIMHCKITSKNI
jgi:hypothetical protein